MRVASPMRSHWRGDREGALFSGLDSGVTQTEQAEGDIGFTGSTAAGRSGWRGKTDGEEGRQVNSSSRVQRQMKREGDRMGTHWEKKKVHTVYKLKIADPDRDCC